MQNLNTAHIINLHSSALRITSIWSTKKENEVKFDSTEASMLRRMHSCTVARRRNKERTRNTGQKTVGTDTSQFGYQEW